jgi:Tfp pilus assembly protein PilN
MATTLIPPTPSPRPPAAKAQHVAVRAHLLPDEIVSARQTEVVRKQVLLGLAIVVALLVGWFGLSWWQTHSANDQLSTAQQQGVALQRQQRQFEPLVTAITQTANINGQLQQLMAGDLSWNQMLATVRKKAPSGISVGSIDGMITAGAAAGSDTTPDPGTSVLNSSGKPTIGSLTVTGLAHDKRSIAAYADQLGTVPGLTAPLISNLQLDNRVFTFTIGAVITSDALTQPAATTGGN